MTGFSDAGALIHDHEIAPGHISIEINAVSMPTGFTRWQWFRQCQRTRRQLLKLSAEQLQDIGLSEHQAHTEALKMFWRI